MDASAKTTTSVDQQENDLVMARDAHLKPINELLQDLDTSPDGLTSAEALDRLGRCGRNELTAGQSTPEIVKFLRQFKNFFALLLICGGALALFAERLDPGQGNLYIAIALIAVVILNAAFTYFQGLQSERIMESFRGCCRRWSRRCATARHATSPRKYWCQAT